MKILILPSNDYKKRLCKIWKVVSEKKKNEILYLETFALNHLFKSIDNIKLASFIKVSKVTGMQPPLLDCEFSSLHII
jgi:hypothetical protein